MIKKFIEIQDIKISHLGSDLHSFELKCMVYIYIGARTLQQKLTIVIYTQVLVDLSGLGRLEWRPWDMFTRPEIGTVAYNSQTFVGRFRHAKAAAHFVVGDLDFNRGLSGNIRAFVSANTTEMSIEGEALV